MTGPNLTKRLPVIVVDHEEGNLAEHIGNILNTQQKGRWSRFRVIRADKIRGVSEMVKRRAVPEYAAIFYKASQVEGNVSVLAQVRRRDPMVPQIIIGGPDNISYTVLMQATRSGVVDYVTSAQEFAETTAGRIFKVQEVPLPQPVHVVKIGGSAFDFERTVKEEEALLKNIQLLNRMLHTRVSVPKTKKATRPNRIIVTVGAGQLGDVIKDFNEKYASNRKLRDHYPKLMMQALSTNLETVYSLFGENNSSLINTGAFYFITRNNITKKVPLTGLAPHYVMVRDGIPLQDSDTHTIALAEFFGVEEIVLIKRTDGIYRYDPMRGFKPDPNTGRCADYDAWVQAQTLNERFGEVTLDDMLNGGISREGTGRDGEKDGTAGHLVEDSGLEYMAKCRHVRRISVVHVSPGEMYVPDRRRNRLEHVVTGEARSPATRWGAVRSKRMRDAFNERAYSSIIRPT